VKLILVISSFYFVTLSSSFADVGFSKGNNFETISLSGRGSIRCLHQNKIRALNCQTNYLNPTEFDYFVLDHEVDADDVTLIANHEDGSKRKKSVQYSSEKQRSKHRVNLWVSTLTQRPLLSVGENSISYSLTNNNSVVEEGEFKAYVTVGESRSCRYAQVVTTNEAYCNDSYMGCELYFREQNYCQ